MKKVSKLLAILLALVFVLSACGGNNNTATTSETESTSNVASGEVESNGGEEIVSLVDDQTLVVGSPEQNGDYINGFGNSSYDVAIKRLIGTYGGDLGYATYYPDEGGLFLANMTILAEEPVRTANEDGSVTYTFKLKDGLKWNDGEAITAKDYVFSQLFANSKEWAGIGATNATSGSELLGYKEYASGEKKEHTGLRLLDDLTFSLTISAENCPYFYETAMVAATPAPLHRYAKNLDVVDNGEGAMIQPKEGYEITDADKASLLENQKKVVDEKAKAVEEELAWAKDNEYNVADWDALLPELQKAATPEDADKLAKEKDPTGEWAYVWELQTAVNDAEAKLKEYEENSDSMDPTTLLMTEAALEVSQVFRFTPDVTCGPYQFESFKNGMAKVTINPNFAGNKDGKKPTIKNIIQQSVNQQLNVDFVISGDVDMAIGVIEGDRIEKAKENPDKVGYVSYPRNGYGNMPMLLHMGATQYKGVRQAIAYSLDREEFVQTVCGGYGVVANAAYGLSQWEYKEKGAELEEKMIHYTLNIDAGNAALDNDSPYKFEKDGKTPWDAAKAEEAYNANKEGFDYWRYDENGKQLVVYHEGTVDNTVTNLIQTQVPDNTKRMGLQYIINTTDFSTLLTHYYTPNEKDEQAPTIFNMATGFSIPNDPYYQTHSSQIGADNKTHINDPKMDEVTSTMRKSDSNDKASWLKGWMEYELWYNENMPEIPLYSNEYFDIYNNRVQGMETSSVWDWANDICDISLAK